MWRRKNDRHNLVYSLWNTCNTCIFRRFGNFNLRGDIVCKYYKVENGVKIYSGTVIKIEMRKNGILIYITNLPNFYYEKAFIGDLTRGYIDTTCYYFCPVEEAEKRLKEL